VVEARRRLQHANEVTNADTILIVNINNEADNVEVDEAPLPTLTSLIDTELAGGRSVDDLMHFIMERQQVLLTTRAVH
jgi:hypothetical protein